jgi:hypothetical protein
MTHSRLFKRAVAVGACAAVGTIGGVAAGAAAPSKDGAEAHDPRAQTECPAPPFSVGGPPMAALAFGAPPVHSVQVVPNKAGDGFDTITQDSGTVKSVSGDKLTISEGTDKATYATPTLTIPSEATIQRNEESAKLSDIQTGDHVDVSSSSDGTTNVFAVDRAEGPPPAPKARFFRGIPPQGAPLPPPPPPGGPVADVEVGESEAEGGFTISCSAHRAP